MKKVSQLPMSWENIKEARNITGTARFASEIIEARLVLMRQCLWDLKTQMPESLIWPSVSSFLDVPMAQLKEMKNKTKSNIVYITKNKEQQQQIYGSTIKYI